MLKKILCAVFCVMMLVCMAVPSMAAEATEEKAAAYGSMIVRGKDNGRDVYVYDGITLRMKPCNSQKLKVQINAKTGKTWKITTVTNSVIYRTSDPEVAKVSSKGVITAGKVGTATITVYHKASGQMVRFQLRVVEPGAPKLKQIRSNNYGITVKWDSVAGACGYEIEYVLNKRWTWLTARTIRVNGGTTKSYTIPSYLLERGAIYDVRIRTLYLNGYKVEHTSWSAKKTVTTQR